MHCRYVFGECALGVPVMVYVHVRGGGGGVMYEVYLWGVQGYMP